MHGVAGNSHTVAPFRWVLLVFQAPGTPIIARQVTPTTIIKQVSQAQTTVQPAAALQRSPGVQVRPGVLHAGTRHGLGCGTQGRVLGGRCRKGGSSLTTAQAVAGSFFLRATRT